MTLQIQYSFTDKERLYFERLQQQFNAGVVNGIQLIVTQQDLPGQWRIKQDGSGIERADLPPELPMREIEGSPGEMLKEKVNGLA